MSATADLSACPLVRLAAAGLILLTIGLADRPLAPVCDCWTHADAASQASSDARHSDFGCSHPDHAGESDIPVMDATDGLGPPRRLYPPSRHGGAAVPQRPPVRPPSL